MAKPSILRSCRPKARVTPVWTICTPQIRSAIAPAKSIKVKVAYISALLRPRHRVEQIGANAVSRHAVQKDAAAGPRKGDLRTHLAARVPERRRPARRRRGV